MPGAPCEAIPGPGGWICPNPVEFNDGDGEPKAGGLDEETCPGKGGRFGEEDGIFDGEGGVNGDAVAGVGGEACIGDGGFGKAGGCEIEGGEVGMLEGWTGAEN